MSARCACGCGAEINPKLGLARELRAAGMPFSRIGEQLNCSGAAIKQLLKNPPRFVKGHSARVNAQIGMALCANPRCRRPFRKLGEHHVYCTTTSARPADEIRAECGNMAFAAKRQRWNDEDVAIEERRVERVKLFAQRRELRLLLAGQKEFGGKMFRERRLAEIQSQIDNLGDELYALYLEQQNDDRWSHRGGSRYLLSLDAPLGDHADGSLYEIRANDDAIAAAFRARYLGHAVTDAWTDVVHLLVDRRREIDEWADELVA